MSIAIVVCFSLLGNLLLILLYKKYFIFLFWSVASCYMWGFIMLLLVFVGRFC